jgi:hypothetical protein
MTSPSKYQYGVYVTKARNKTQKKWFRKSRQYKVTPKVSDEFIETRSQGKAKSLSKKLNKTKGITAKVGKIMGDENTISLEQRFSGIEVGASPGEDTKVTRARLRQTLEPSEVLNPDIPYEYINREEFESGEYMDKLRADKGPTNTEIEDAQIKNDIDTMNTRLAEERDELRKPRKLEEAI